MEQNNNTAATHNNDDDVWAEDEYRVDWESAHHAVHHYDNFVASLNYNRLRETFVTLGIKEGVSEGLDEARQAYFEKGLESGLREGIVCGFIVQLLTMMMDCAEQERELIGNLKANCVLWKKEKMEQVLKWILHCSSSSNLQEELESLADEELKLIGGAVLKFGAEVEMFNSTYGDILRY